MLWWRKKNDGFVWQEYVRTTLLLRREQRKQRIEDMRGAAVDGIKNAGRQGVALSVAGASAAGRGVASTVYTAVAAIGDWIAVTATATWLWLADRSGPARAALGSAAGTVVDTLSKPAVSAPVLLIGAVALVSAAAGWNGVSFDRNGAIAIVIATIAFILAAIPYVAAFDLPGRTHDLLARIPVPRSLSGDAGAALGLGAVLAVFVGGLTFVIPALSPAGGTAPAITSAAKPVLTPASGRIEGKAAAVSADQLRVAGEIVRLFGIEAPASGQLCPGQKSCALSAKTALQKLTSGKRVTCEVSARQSDGVPSATCQVNGADIAGQLVRGGHVFATTGLFATYAGAEREARSAKAGIWRTDPERPDVHRARVWEEAKKAAPDGCPIKGVLAGEAKTYVVPWSAGYEKAKVRLSRGEKWFCTETEARAAGWKPAEPS